MNNEIIENEPIEKVLKKRGRKPKNKIEPDISISTLTTPHQNIESIDNNMSILKQDITLENSINNNELPDISENDNKVKRKYQKKNKLAILPTNAEELETEIDTKTKIEEKMKKNKKIKEEIEENSEDDKLEEENKNHKKRGRKPKEKVYSIYKEEKNNVDNVDLDIHLILHLPISIKEVQNQLYMSDRDILQYNPTLSEPKPYDENDYSNYEIINNASSPINTKENIWNNILSKNEENSRMNDIPNNINNSLMENDINQINQINTIIENSKMSDISTVFENKSLQRSNNMNPIQNVTNNDVPEKQKSNSLLFLNNDNSKKRIIQIMFEFIDSKNKNEWPINTNIYCMWCCHPFDWSPCAIPQSYIDEKFMVSGCYCSFNCAASYIFNEKVSTMWEKYSLLNLMYKKIYGTPFVKIPLAPPRQLLKIFGGILTIEEFRENSQKFYKVVEPPLIPILPKVEENIIDSSFNKPAKKINKTHQIIQNNEHIQNLKDKYQQELTDTYVKGKTLYTYLDLHENNS
jgi:hypothetical protein